MNTGITLEPHWKGKIWENEKKLHPRGERQGRADEWNY